MTLSEFNNEFDILYNSITSNQAPGLDTYEKSVFLTKAQDEILLAYFDPRSNKVLEGFDGSERRQIDFSKITRTSNYSDKTSNSFATAYFDPRSNSQSISLPPDILIILNERVEVSRNGKKEYLTVVPVHFQEYNRLMSKPYKRPLHYQAWRVINYNGGNRADLVVGPSDVIEKYSIRYVKRPHPIILGDLDDLTIEGFEFDNTECEVDPILHHEILQRAVEMANIAYKVTSEQYVAALSNTSLTQVGVPPQSNNKQ